MFGLLVSAVCLAVATASGPTQIHLAFGHAPSEMTVSWSTAVSSASVVQYGVSKDALTSSAAGEQIMYTTKSIPRDSKAYEVYTSPFLHHTTLYHLDLDTTYYYRVGDNTTGDFSDVFSFKTLGSVGSIPDGGFQFDVIGDLGQTNDSQTTIAHVVEDGNTQFLMHAGDMSYADCLGSRWDSYFDLMEDLSTSLPWMVCPGNHEVEPSLSSTVTTETTTVTSGSIMTGYKYRYRMPQVAAGVDTTKYFQDPANDGWDCTPSAFTGSYDFGNSFYSFNAGPVHFLFLNSYTGVNTTSPQYKWLEEDLKSVDRTVTPWCISVFHSPWYSSNTHHYGEFNAVDMRDAMEPLLHKYGLSMAFSGHVHAYQRSKPVYLNQTVSDAATYLVIGDGGNREGHATGYHPDPSWSAFKDDTEFGHGRVIIVNATHAKWEWHRNDEGAGWVVGDSAWIENTPLARMLNQQN